MNSPIKQMIQERTRLAHHGLYRPEHETANCGVGLIAATDGKPRRDVVLKGIEALKALWHRGAVDADGKTGDGAGIHLQIPEAFFRDYIRPTSSNGDTARLAVGQIFLPRNDLAAQERTRQIIESQIIGFGYSLFGWRQVPVDASVIGWKANATRPEIEQVVIGDVQGRGSARFETDLYIIRRRIERLLREENLQNAYICSLSCRSMIYKGLFLAEQLDSFYPDLRDERFVSNFAIYHQRYSTNTFPAWSLAQPFRVLAHNGEINTIAGNINWMRCHEVPLADEAFGPYVEDLKPVIAPSSSDSAALDAVAEILLRTRRELPEVKSLLIPQSWEGNPQIPKAHQDFYRYANAIMEPWDGPAAICAYGGRWVLAGMDRNGLRPLRYAIYDDDLLVVGSETGMIRRDPERQVALGRLGPGSMIGVNLQDGKLYFDQALKDHVAGLNPFGSWVRQIRNLRSKTHKPADAFKPFDPVMLKRAQLMAGWSLEESELILQPMANEGKEATGSMGDDTPPAMMARHWRGLHPFFRQNFSQVTNPPIDSLRERQAMSLKTRLGNLGNILAESKDQLQVIELDSPILTSADFTRLMARLEGTVARIDCCFDRSTTLEASLASLQDQAAELVAGGPVHLVLDNCELGEDRIPIPMILATGAVHHRLIDDGLRTFTSLNIRSLEALDAHHHAVLIGVGATCVHPVLAEMVTMIRHSNSMLGDLTLAQAVGNLKKALEDGLAKIMSKMGIAVLSSYRGGCNFEALGLSRTLTSRFFPGLPSRISGIGLGGIEQRLRDTHEQAWQHRPVVPVGGFYRYRQTGELHAWRGDAIHLLQEACIRDSYALYKRYSRIIAEGPPVHLRDLLDFRLADANSDDTRIGDTRIGDTRIGLEEVVSITEIRKRMVAPGISLGALSQPAHEILSIAMNRIGARSDSGEGGEDPARYQPRENGDRAVSAIKQVASGRFGVTAEYLNHCKELEIKIAQGAKPGEGGQLPGFKVSELIAKLRHSTPGVTLISPPPHHDIYSIEDLAQLIYDLKQINPQAKICVKLVAKSGIGTVAAGVAKAHADVILISGHSGGTGASPQSSIKYAGLPWEMGLAEVHQVLSLNRLRDRVTLRTDGGIKTGRDIVIAALLGAEEYGIGTASLVAMGCIMVRQCHSNTCPVGVCTQDPKLIERFTGTPEKVVNLFSFIAEEVRDILAQLGATCLEEVIGRTELLRQVSRGNELMDDLDLNPILVRAESAEVEADAEDPKVRFRLDKPRNPVPSSLDARILEDASALFAHGEKLQLQYTIRNSHRAIGTMVSSRITRQFGQNKLAGEHLHVRMRGTAGQSLGAFAVRGLKLEVLGDANDYVGKGLSGAEIIVRPSLASHFVSSRNTIIGNTCLYGATSGMLFAAGQAGERFCVRNSGALAIVEGCGANGCEYMTGGTAIILGSCGVNFAAGMTGGQAFLLDLGNRLEARINKDTVGVYRVENPEWQDWLYQRIAMYYDRTKSAHAEELLGDWPRYVPKFWQIVPHDVADKIMFPVKPAHEAEAPAFAKA
ncbi:MAG: glutamate synthase large subunit [Pseudomonadota bacterium]